MESFGTHSITALSKHTNTHTHTHLPQESNLNSVTNLMLSRLDQVADAAAANTHTHTGWIVDRSRRGALFLSLCLSAFCLQTSRDSPAWPRSARPRSWS